MAVAEATHHSSRGQRTATAIREGGGEQVPNVGLRAHKAPPPGERPGCLADPGPQRCDRSLRHSAGDTRPTLGLPVLALAFLTRAALEERRKDEVERHKTDKAKELVVMPGVGEWVELVDEQTGRTYHLHPRGKRPPGLCLAPQHLPLQGGRGRRRRRGSSQGGGGLRERDGVRGGLEDLPCLPSCSCPSLCPPCSWRTRLLVSISSLHSTAIVMVTESARRGLFVTHTVLTMEVASLLFCLCTLPRRSTCPPCLWQSCLWLSDTGIVMDSFDTGPHTVPI